MATRAPRTQGIRTYGSGGAASKAGTAKRSAAAARKRSANLASRASSLAGGVGNLGTASGRGTTRPGAGTGTASGRGTTRRPGYGTGTAPESGTKSKKLANLRQDRLKKGADMKDVMRSYKSDLASWKKSKPSSPTKTTAAQRQRIADETTRYARYAKSQRGNR
jgi:hypothetical protein